MEQFKRTITVVVIAVMVLLGMLPAYGQPVFAASETGATTKVTTDVSTKTTNKSVKMKSKAKQSKVTTKTVTKKYSKVLSNTDKKKVTQAKTVKTTTKTTYKKKSKIKKVKKTVKTTIKTTTTTYKVKSDAEKINEIKKSVPSNIMSAYNKLGFTIKLNKNLSTAGNFSTSKRYIQLKNANADHLLHEMGHFLSCVKGDAAKTDSFTQIYSAEKSKYTGSNKKYVTSTSDEYFAESYRDYVKCPATLQKQRPKTYNYIKSTAASITQKDMDNMTREYGWAW